MTFIEIFSYYLKFFLKKYKENSLVSFLVNFFPLAWLGSPSDEKPGGDEFPVDTGVGKYEYERGQDQLEEKEEDTVEKSPVLVIPAFHAVGSLGDSENIQQLIKIEIK